MSLRRGLQAVVNVLKRRVRQQAQQYDQSARQRQRPDGKSQNSGPVIEQFRPTKHEIFQQIQPNWASRASHFWKSTTRTRFPNANGNRFPSRGPALPFLFGFAGVGFVSRTRFDNVNTAGIDDNSDERQGFHLDLETATHLVRSIFRGHGDDEYQLDPSTRVFPTEIDGYALSDRVLAKGTEGVVYAAKLQEDHLSLASESIADDSNNCDDLNISSNPGGMPDLEDSEHQKQDTVRGVSEQEDQSNLAVKMLFNYNIGSTHAELVSQFQAEQLPLLMAHGKFGKTDVKKRKSRRYHHPNIVQMYQSFVDRVMVPNIMDAMALFDVALPCRLNIGGAGADTTLYVVMKRYQMSLRDYVTTTGPPADCTAMVMMAQMLEGVGYLVAHGVVHRDLKSNNILVDVPSDRGSPHVVLADFGCAVDYHGRALSDCVTVVDRNRQGNSALMAPELKQANASNTLRYCDYLKSDEWALGAIAYEIRGQLNPFYSNETGHGLDSRTYREQDLPKLRTQSIGLGLVVQLLLQRDPIKRPAPHVAANILHLFLWRPSVSGLLRLCQGQTTTNKELAMWIIQIVMTYALSMGSPYGSRCGVPISDMPQTFAEHSLLAAFMKRVDSRTLDEAAGYIVAMFRGIFTPQIPPDVSDFSCGCDTVWECPCSMMSLT